MTEYPQPIVSVIVPIYNVEAHLDDCLESIIGQTYRHLEIIVVDDYSTDGSMARLQRHLADPRVHLIKHKKNFGLSAARNTGIEAATGKYVMFVDSDDAVASSLVEACVLHAEELDASILVFDFETFQDGSLLPKVGATPAASKVRNLQKSEYFALPHFAWLKFIRADVLLNPAMRFPDGLYYEDWPFHWELGFSNAPIWMLQDKWYCYRLRKKSITASSGRKMLDQFKVQEMVLGALQRRNNECEMREVSKKIYMSFWAILMRIEHDFLAEALAESKNVRTKLNSILPAFSLGARNRIMSLVISLPLPVAICAIKSIRLIRGGTKIRNQRKVHDGEQT